MADLIEDYLARAAEARAAASLEVLANVREKHLTAAATWDDLARSKLPIDALRAGGTAAMTADHTEIRPAGRRSASDRRFPRSRGDGYISNDRTDPPLPGDADIGAIEECRFEIFREDEERMTSTLFSGGDWRWQLITTGGLILAEASGYPNEQTCRMAVAVLQRRAATAPVIAKGGEA